MQFAYDKDIVKFCESKAIPELFKNLVRRDERYDEKYDEWSYSVNVDKNVKNKRFLRAKTKVRNLKFDHSLLQLQINDPSDQKG